VESELRLALQEITDRYIGWNAYLQIPAIEKLNERDPHSIRLLQKAIPGRLRTINYNGSAVVRYGPPTNRPDPGGISPRQSIVRIRPGSMRYCGLPGRFP
jgi:hypothetical protein